MGTRRESGSAPFERRGLPAQRVHTCGRDGRPVGGVGGSAAAFPDGDSSRVRVSAVRAPAFAGATGSHVRPRRATGGGRRGGGGRRRPRGTRRAPEPAPFSRRCL